jgi:hypothetical protein
MRRWISVLTGSALLLGGLAYAGPAGAIGTTASLHTGQRLKPGQRLVSANGHYRALITTASGRLIVERTNGVRLWNSPATRRGTYVTVGGHGGLVIKSGAKIVWALKTSGSGASDVLTMGNDGVLALTAHRAPVWSTRALNACPATKGKTFVVDLSQQRARMCDGGQQLRTTLVTTGASAHGDATPKGTWRVQARVRNTTLHPAAGGAYPVKYWLPYNGPYGAHDSPWQKFAYGSSLYKTKGSHGCVHVPGAMMAWLFNWARVGTTVTIHG